MGDPIHSWGKRLGKGLVRRWLTILEEEIFIGHGQRGLGEESIDMFAHGITRWEFEGQCVPHYGCANRVN